MAALPSHDRLGRTIHSGRPTPAIASHHYPAELHYVKSLFLSAQYHSCILACRDMLAQVRYSSAGTHRSNPDDAVQTEKVLDSDNNNATSTTQHHQSLSPAKALPLQDTFLLFYTALSHDALARSGDNDSSFISARHFYTAALESLPASSDGAQALYLLAGLAGRERTERLSTQTVTQDGDDTITFGNDSVQSPSHSRSTSDQTTRGPFATAVRPAGHAIQAERNDSPMMDQVLVDGVDRGRHSGMGEEGKRMDAMVDDDEFYDQLDENDDEDVPDVNEAFPWLSLKLEQQQQHQRYDSALGQHRSHTASLSLVSDTSSTLPRDYSRMSLLDEFPLVPVTVRTGQSQQQQPLLDQLTSTEDAAAIPLRHKRAHLQLNHHQHHQSLPRLSLVTPYSSAGFGQQQRDTTATIFPPSASSASASASISAVSTTSSHLRRWSEFPPASATAAASGATATTNASRFTNGTTSTSRYHDALWDNGRDEPEPVSPLTAEEYFRSEQAELKEKLERLERKKQTRASLGNNGGGNVPSEMEEDDEEDDPWAEEEEKVSPVSPLSPATPVGGAWEAGARWFDARRKDILHGGLDETYGEQTHEDEHRALSDEDDDEYDYESTDESQTFHDARDHALSLSSPSSAFTSTFPSPMLSATSSRHATLAAARSSYSDPETDAATAAAARHFETTISEMRHRITHHLAALADAENAVAECAAEREWQSKLKYEQLPVTDNADAASVVGETAGATTFGSTKGKVAAATEKKTAMSLSERILAGRARAWLRPRFRPARYRALCEAALAEM